MSPPPILPLDVYHLIKFFTPSQDLLTHLNLSNTSSLIRNELYPRDESWKPLLQSCGLSRSMYDLNGVQRTKGSSSWRSLVLDLVAHERRGCEAETVVGVDPGSEGVLGKVYWERLCVCTARRMLSFQTGASPVPLTPEEVREGEVELRVNDHVKLAFPSFAGLLTMDDRVGIRRRGRVGEAENPKELWKSVVRMGDHPTAAYSFATSPPVTELLLWFGYTLVSNPDGVTVWDVRQAFLNSPVLSTGQNSANGLILRGADTWLESAFGENVSHSTRLGLFGRDGWEQEGKGSVRIAHESMWAPEEE
ncbi:hypothetical protein BDY24DRAFT_393405 [Mrakia frigida]|uniref:uncharacterized protein n=1 Tax=Mrakia frigida TaxID=29902 RepID=UPI003FCC0E5C